MTKYVVLYESADDVARRAPEHRAGHRSRLDDFHARGEIIMAGPFGDPQAEGSMAVFPTRVAAEAFIEGDPFVRHGVVCRHEIREWNEILLP